MSMPKSGISRSPWLKYVYENNLGAEIHEIIIIKELP